MDASLSLINQGNTAEIYDMGGGKILKLFKEGISAETCRREFENTRAAGALLGNVPRAFEEITLNGRPGIVYEKVIGTNMLDHMLSHIWTIRSQSVNLAEYHAGIQKEVQAEMPSVKAKLGRDILAATFLTAEEKDKVLSRMQTLPDGNRLCHFDFHPGNIIFAEGGPVIIDWMTACKGDPAADAARTRMMLKYGLVPRASKWVQAAAHAVQSYIYRIYSKHYLKITGIKKADVQKWELPIAAARLHEWISEEEKTALLNFIRRELAV
ncbi:MAG TPA: aminoglycoside phosphotransferase family protein [Clostridia bacterium]|nr:aminoglycoside phosphotransferase family protein [Clostridia bacterium]